MTDGGALEVADGSSAIEDATGAAPAVDTGPAIRGGLADGGAAEANIGTAISDFAADGNVVGDATVIGPPTIGNDGYLTVDAGSIVLLGYVASYTGGSSSNITLTYGSTAFCASGSVAPNSAYQSWAGAGFNLNQTHSTTGGIASALSLSGNSMTLSFENVGGSPLRIQLIDNSFNFWCYTLTQPAGPVTIAMSSFNTHCWDNSGQSFQPGTDIQTLQLIVPGSDTTSTPFNFCFLGVTIQ